MQRIVWPLLLAACAVAAERESGFFTPKKAQSEAVRGGSRRDRRKGSPAASPSSSKVVTPATGSGLPGRLRKGRQSNRRSGSNEAQNSTVQMEFLGEHWTVRAIAVGNAGRSGDVLLLHGQRFSAETWLSLGTLHAIDNAGWRAIAIDLPGSSRGKTKGPGVQPEVRGKWLTGVMNRMKLRSPVVIAPSMAGTFAIPALIEYPDRFAGFIPVSPAGSGKYDWASVDVSTLVVWGGQDEAGFAIAKRLKKMPNAQTFELRAAGHACYTEFPRVWNSRIGKFLTALHQKEGA